MTNTTPCISIIHIYQLERNSDMVFSRSMSMASVHEILRQDEGVQSMIRLYAVLNDWYDNIHQAKRGVRACERVTQIRERGLEPLAQRYFKYVATEAGVEFTGSAQELLSDWEDEFRPDYVTESDTYDWDDYERGLQRGLLDAETRLGSFAVDIGIEVNNATINIYDEDELRQELQDEFEALWSEWFRRMDDLYWDRRGRLYKQIVRELEEGILETEDKKWTRYRDRYPELPSGTRIGGERIY